MPSHSFPGLQTGAQAFPPLHLSWSWLREGASAGQLSSAEAILYNCVQGTVLEAGGPGPALLKRDLGGPAQGPLKFHK